MRGETLDLPLTRRFEPPPPTLVISCSEKVLCVGMNYVDHCLEQGAPIPIEPTIFK